jgi:hypothetical protein
MVQIDVPAAFAVGSFFADAASKQLQTGDHNRVYQVAWKNNIFQIFFFLWIPIYFIMNFFGWETTYRWWEGDSVTAYPSFLPLFVIIFFAAANAGFFLGNWFVSRRKLIANRCVYLGITLYCLIWIFGQTDRTLQVGTFSQWAANKSVMFYDDSAFLKAFTIVMVVWISGVVGFGLNLRKAGNSSQNIRP